jgi:glycosyltransferase involved in cell wall biosynthesis
MPAYNRSALITRALDSIANQDHHPQAVIVVDDASDDDTVECVMQWRARTGLNVVIERLETNQGAAAARNRGIELANTRYVAFLDTDDEHLPETLGKLVRALDATAGAVAAFGDATKITPDHRLPNAMFQQRVNIGVISEFIGSDQLPIYRLLDPKSTFLRASLIPTCASCFSRSAALAIGGMPTQYRTGEDWMFWLKLSEHGSFVFYREDLAVVHRHAENLTHPSLGVETSSQKLIGYAALLDGTSGLSMTDSQKHEIKTLIAERATLLRYQASLMGLATYVRSLRLASKYTGKSFIGQAIGDPRSLSRAVISSAIRRPQLAPD